jgi:hypothetical protein
MKTYKRLYPQIHTFANLYWAYRAARCGKRDRAAVVGFEFDLERNLWRLQRELQEQTYQRGAYTNFYIYEPKRHLVSAAPVGACTTLVYLPAGLQLAPRAGAQCLPATLWYNFFEVESECGSNTRATPASA